jgi:hypothetical protein
MTTSDDRPEPLPPSEVDRAPLEQAAERIGEARKAADEVADQQNLTEEERTAAADAVAEVLQTDHGAPQRDDGFPSDEPPSDESPSDGPPSDGPPSDEPADESATEESSQARAQ